MNITRKLESNISAVKIGLNGCNYQINEYFDTFVKQITDRKLKLQNTLQTMQTHAQSISIKYIMKY